MRPTCRHCVGVVIAALAVVSPVHSAPAPVPEHVPVTTPVHATPYSPEGAEEQGLWMEVDETERRLKTSPQLISDPALNGYVRSVLCRTVGERQCAAARLYILRTPDANASMAPNGMIQLNSGMLLHLTSEAQLASVLGHEFAHYEHRHALLFFRESKKKNSASLWLAMTGIGLLAAFGIENSLFRYSRDMEREADMDGLRRMAAAGYAQSEAVAPWKLLRAEWDGTAAERKRRSHSISDDKADGTHPSMAERIAYTEAEAAKQAPGAEIGTAPYQAALGQWLPGFLDDQVKRNDFGASDVLIAQLAERTHSPWLLVAHGDLYRTRAQPGDLDKAAGFYGEALAADGDLPLARRGRGLTLLKLGRADEAKADLRAYLARSPDAPDRAMIAMLAGEHP